MPPMTEDATSFRDDANDIASDNSEPRKSKPRKKVVKRSAKKETKKPSKKTAKKTTKKAAAKKTTKKTAKKAAAKKTASKKTAAKKAAAKKTTKKAASKKATAKKTASKKTTTKKAVTKKASKKKVKAAEAEPEFDFQSDTEPTAEPAAKSRSKKKSSKKKTKTGPRDDAPAPETETESAADDGSQGRGPRDGGSGRDGEDEGDRPRKKRRRRRRRRSGGEGSGEGSGERSSERSGDSDGRRDGRGDRRDDRRPRQDSGDHDEHTARRARKRAKLDANAESARQRDPSIFADGKTFYDLDLSDEVVEGLAKAGIKHPTAIQAGMIPVAVEGRDVLGQAKTGTGKTAAFSLPLIELCDEGDPFQAVIVAPTRELAVQITQEFNRLAKGTRLRAITIYGGAGMGGQIEQLQTGPEVIVGTPGRLLDMAGRGHLKLGRARFAVLDEVDRMFDIGFRDDIRRILDLCPRERQTLVVSATISPEIEELARQHMRNPEKIVTSAGSLTVALVEQHHLPVQLWDKRRLLLHLLTHEEPALTVVFCRLKRTVDDIAGRLNDKGIESFAIHGDLPQRKREQIFKKLKAGKLEVLIASDLAARGLDVDGITHVINYDLPDDPEVYVHRIGRTARIGRKGVAWSLVTPEQGKLLTEIEILVGQEIPKLEYPDFKPRPRPDNWKDAPPQGHVIVEGVPDKKGKSRHAIDLPAADPKKADPKKFPGGVVPTALPPKRLGGRTRTRRGK
ncbi:MAG: DEAD/DEAH box helicase [Planctomycetota bacterium]